MDSSEDGAVRLGDDGGDPVAGLRGEPSGAVVCGRPASYVTDWYERRIKVCLDCATRIEDAAEACGRKVYIHSLPSREAGPCEEMVEDGAMRQDDGARIEDAIEITRILSVLGKGLEGIDEGVADPALVRRSSVRLIGDLARVVSRMLGREGSTPT